MQFKLMVTCFLVVLFSAAGLRAQIADEIPMDARSIAMGEAGTAAAEGPAAVWHNAGALALHGGLGFSAGGRRLIPEFADDIWIGNLAASFGDNGWGVGAHFTYLSYGDQETTDSQGQSLGVTTPFEYTLRLGASIDILRFFPEINEKFKLGVGGTVNKTQVDFKDFGLFANPTVATSADAWDVDLAALLQMRHPVDVVSEDDYLGARFGIRWENVSNQELVFEGSDQGSSLGRAVHVGVALEGGLRETQLWQHLLHGVITFDTQIFTGEESDRSSIYKFGFEVSPGFQRQNHTFFLAGRAGYTKDEDGGVNDATIGGALGDTYRSESREYSFILEYANLPQSSGLSRRHHASFGVKVSL